MDTCKCMDCKSSYQVEKGIEGMLYSFSHCVNMFYVSIARQGILVL